jgi:superfamily II DNA or RNA helicase
MQLRPTQEIDVNKVSQMLASGKRKVVLQEPTGTGKTVIFSAIAHRYTTKATKSVLILVHRKKLLKQTRVALFNGFNIASQAITAGMRHVPAAKVYVGMIESVIKRLHMIKEIGLVIIDEAHLEYFNKIHEHYPTQYIIAFTATPQAANKKKPMKNFYEDIVCGPQISELIKLGYLCQNITYSPRDGVDRSKLEIKNGEFDNDFMAQQFGSPRYVNNTVTAYKKYSPGTKAIVFNVNIQHCHDVNTAFLLAGYDSRVFDSTLSQIEQENILNWFEHTPGAILNSINILTAGFDEPTIETVIFNRATLSMPLWIQCTGRGSRPTPSKSAFCIIDLGSNATTHGDWCDDRAWDDIFYNPPKSKKTVGVAPVKVCPECEAILATQARTCKICGFEFPTKEQALEEELSDFVIVTKGIDVRSVIENNREKKIYYPFFKIGKDIAAEAKKSIPAMNDELAGFVFSRYEDLAKVWCAEVGKKYNQWHADRAREHLYNELSERFKKWNNPLKQTAVA